MENSAVVEAAKSDKSPEVAAAVPTLELADDASEDAGGSAAAATRGTRQLH